MSKNVLSRKYPESRNWPIGTPGRESIQVTSCPVPRKTILDNRNFECPERARAQQSVPTVWRLWKRFGVDMVDNSNGMVGRMEEEKENQCQHKLRSLRWFVKRTMATLHASLSAAVVAKTNKKSELSCNCSRMLLFLPHCLSKLVSASHFALYPNSSFKKALMSSRHLLLGLCSKARLADWQASFV